jgi:ribosomal protein S27AE
MTASTPADASRACPKCGYLRHQTDSGRTDECPHCGVIYAKYLQHQAQFALRSHIVDQDDDDAITAQTQASAPLQSRIGAALWYTPDRVDRLLFYGNALVFAGSVLWGLWFILQPVTGDAIGASFLHRVNLPFHEFGHVLFRPFGTWLMFLGGSLFQCVLPLILAAYFLHWQGQPFSASVCLW